ncbi:hypothetical protein KC332_g8938 [Hortaea werneckii]|uniref:Uncharacterized protein n=2 Tax=Hortaea werneckii TaxID=91943 RepID=A0A3M7I825_HORWE|nr:hypothetical protein KC358_g8710 [Hortaea werneckii]OTA28068.1 hypothetical protein BTJ68_10857 [Hortaea werneckii EXF-2000]KAI6828169.1 hypothetical protein KC350_g8167 [Hortaea werneckii]KAI6924752.1 hypothetical protein KC348_g9182 [Hortaea werneckii]KAI6933009.1 hypothetical protein KC341_g8591 [Hortaea werneckii]
MAHDDLNPTGPVQPPLDQVYETQGNPITKEPAEQVQAQRHAREAAQQPTDQRIPAQQATYSEATPSSLGRGIHGAGPGEEAQGRSHQDVGRSNELDAEQMAAPGEGKIADAVTGNNPAVLSGGGEPGMETDLDRKKREQAPLREAVQEQQREGFDVGGMLGQRGGPANPVDKDNYPNTDRV